MKDEREKLSYATWLETVPAEIAADELWKLEAYRLALFAGDLAWWDVTNLNRDRRTWDLAGQLYRSVGSVEANLAEGYSRGGGRDRARFYEFALGSARESRGWYYKARHALGNEVSTHRMRLLTHIIRLLLRMIPDQRCVTEPLHDTRVRYGRASQQPGTLDQGLEADLLASTPLPRQTD